MLIKKDKAVAIVSIFIFTCVIFGFGVFLVTLKSDDVKLLKQRGIKTQGVLIEKQCSNHHTIRYSFKVANEEYYGKGNLCTVEMCYDAKIGDPVVVHYLENNPDVSRCGSLDVAQGNVFHSYVIVLFFSVLFFSYMTWLISGSKRQIP